MLRRRSVAILACLAMFTTFACDGTARRALRAEQVRAAANAGRTDPAALVGGRWRASHAGSRLADRLARSCGRPVRGLGAPTGGLLRMGVSPVRVGPLRGEAVGGEAVRTSLLVYRRARDARAALEGLGGAALQRCLARAVDQRLATTERSGSVADQSRIVQSRWTGGALGGRATVCVARLGALLSTAVLAAAPDTHAGGPTHPHRHLLA